MTALDDKARLLAASTNEFGHGCTQYPAAALVLYWIINAFASHYLCA